MRISLHRSACTSAVALTLIALPCLAQPAPGSDSYTITLKKLTIPCKDASHLSDCTARMKAQEAEQAKLLSLAEKEQEKLQMLAPRLDATPSSRCLALRVYKFPKNYPETNRAAVPSVTDCESASLFNEKTTELRVRRAKH